jgi:hypothetical protein
MSGYIQVPADLTSEKNAETHWTRGWVDVRVGMDGSGEEKISFK